MVPGGALRIAVDPSGNAWVVNSTNNVYHFENNSFVLKPGTVIDVGVGANGSIWCTGKDKRIYQWDGSNWAMQTGGATQISVAPDGNAWVVNDGGDIYHTNNVTPMWASNISYVPPAKNSGKVRFQNTGNIAVKLYRTTADNQQTFITEIAANSGLDIDAKLGEGYTVQINDDKVTHRKMYVVDLDETIFITGNVAMKDFAGYGTSFSMLNIDPNLFGVDTTVLNTKNLVTSMGKKQIFERLDISRGIDYETQPPYLIKVGFNYAAYPLTVSTNGSRMSYGYSSYSSSWNIAASGSFPVKAVDVSGGFGYGETNSNQSSTTDVYTYSRHQVLTHQVAVTPTKAYLNPEFVDRVRKVTDAASADQLIRDYGTHYPETIFYGGDLSSYLRMTSTDYTKANSMNLDVQAAVEVSTPTTKQQKGYGKTTTSQGSSYGGKMNFSMNTNQEQRSLLEKSESQCKVIGGEYTASGDYTVNEANSAPLVVSLTRIDELIDPKVFKDDTDPAILFKIRNLVKDATDRYIKARVSTTKPIQLPPPNVYVVTLSKMSVTSHIDDANSNTKGKVVAAVFSDAALKQKIQNLSETLWSQSDYSLDFRFSPNFSRDFGNKLFFTHYPNPSTGKFDPLYLNLFAEVREKDDILWAPDGAYMAGNSGPIDLNALNLQPGGAAASRSLDISSSGNGSIRVNYSIEKEQTVFDIPGINDAWTTTPQNSVTQTGTPDNETELTLINGGGYAAKFKVDYTINGYAKSYESGEVALGWKYKLALPPNATNIRVQGFYSNLGWKSIFDETMPTASDKCFKVYGTIWNAAKNNDCN
jgi:hypothetical protein